MVSMIDTKIYVSCGLFFLIVVIFSGIFEVFWASMEILGNSNYQYYTQTEFNSALNTTSRNVVLLSSILKRNEFISYFAPSGNYIIIAPFGNSTYGCSGSCNCLDSVEDLNRSSNLANSLFFIATASSAAFACSYALRYYEETCFMKYSSVCSKIKTNIEKFTRYSSYSENTISRFLYGQFDCVGTCECENNRKSSNIFSKSLYFAVSAISLSLAVKIASDFFHSECSISLSNNCPEDSIKSEVEFCENSEDSDSEDLKRELSVGEEPMNRGYFCRGYCLNNERKFVRVKVKEMNCKEKVLEGKVVVTVPKDSNLKNHNLYARYKFLKENLRPFCVEGSMFRTRVVVKHKDGYTEYRKWAAPLCYGSVRGSGTKNVHCNSDYFLPKRKKWLGID